MSVRRTVPFMLLATLAAANACGAPGEPREEGEGGADGEPWSGAVLGEPIPRPGFVLTDTEGEPFDFRARTEGDVALLFFGYTHCPDICPVHMANLAAVLRDLPLEVSRRIQVVFVTTDPARDTPERLREWLGALHPRFIGLTGSPDEIRAAEASVGVPPSVVQEAGDSTGYFVGHAGQVFAFGADGPARVVYPFGVRQRDWLKDLPRLVRETSGDAGEG